MSRLAAVARTTSFAAIIAAFFPVLAVIAPKSTVIVLVAAGLYGMIIAVRRRIRRDLFPPVPASLMAAVMGWILYKSLATVGGWVSFELWLRLTALVLCGFAALWLFRTLSSEEKRRVHDALIAGIVAGLLLLWLIFVAYRYSGIILVGADRGDPLTAVSSGQAIIAMLSGLAWCVLLQRRRRGAALLLIAATLASFAPLPSNYAILAVILGVLDMVWGTSLHSSSLKALAVALVAAVLAGPIIAATSIHGLADDPVLIATIKRVDSTGSFERSIRHRLQIWAFVAERAQEHPYLGWGLDASRRIPGEMS